MRNSPIESRDTIIYIYDLDLNSAFLIKRQFLATKYRFVLLKIGLEIKNLDLRILKDFFSEGAQKQETLKESHR